MPRVDRKLIRATEAFKAFDISPTTGYKAIKDGTLPIEPIKVGGQWKFRAVDVERIVNGTRRSRRRLRIVKEEAS